MNLKTRRILLCIFIILFIFIGISITFYSNGWRFDLATFTISKLGAIFFENIPIDVTIKIEKANLKFEPNILKSSLLIANLFPKTYPITISKTGYQPWYKEITVAPSLVTPIPPIILLPEKFNLGSSTADNIIDFWEDKNILINLKKDKTLEFEFKKIIGQEVIDLSGDNEIAITKSANNYFLINLQNSESAINLSLLSRNLIKPAQNKNFLIAKLALNPKNTNQIIIETDKGLYLLNYKNFSIKLISQEKIEDFSIWDNELIFASLGKIFIYNLDSNYLSPIITKNFGEIKNLRMTRDGNFISLINNQNKLYLIDKKSLADKEISENVLNSSFSPDSKKIAFIKENKDLIIQFTAISSEKENQRKNAVFNFGSLENIVWHKNSAYLLLKYPSGLYLLEANNLPPINFQVIDSENQKFRYSSGEDAVYLLKNSSLYKIYLR